MVCDDAEHSARLQRITYRRQRTLERLDFVVTHESKTLEDSRLVSIRYAITEGAMHGRDQIIARLERMLCSPLYNHRRKTPRTTFVSITVKNIRQLDLAHLVQKVRRATTSQVRSHARIQRNTPAVREATRILVELMRGNAQVQKRTGQMFVELRCDIREIATNESRPIAERLEPPSRRIERCLVSIHSDQPCLPSPAQYCRRVPSSAHRSIQIQTAALRLQYR
jgi:hypothetical protein